MTKEKQLSDQQEQKELNQTSAQEAEQQDTKTLSEQEFLDSASDKSELDEYLNMYVGEGKKYKDVKELAKAYANADVFIETLKREKRDLERELQEERDKYKTLADVLDSLNSNALNTSVNKKEISNENKNKEEDIYTVVKKVLDEERQQYEIQQKKLQTKEKLIQAFGDEKTAAEKIQQFVKDNPAKKSVVEILATTDPDALIKLINDQPQQQQEQKKFSPTVGGKSASNDSIAKGVLPITWSEARRIRKENPQYYRSHKFQQLLHRAALEAQKQGIDFYRT